MRTLFAALIVSAVFLSPNALALEPLDANGLTDTLTELLDTHPTAKRTTVALKVVDLETGDVLFDRGGDKLLTPASNLKIYTSAAALALLGPEYRWTTNARLSGHVADGTLYGDLMIWGDGDPMFDTEQLRSLITKVVEENELTTVRGEVAVSDGNWRGVPLKGPGWMWDDDPDYYNMSIQPVMLDFNTLEVLVEPGAGVGDLGKVSLTPATYEPLVHDAVRTVEGGKSSVSIDRDSFEHTVKVRGVIGVDAKPVSDRITMHDPSAWIGSVVTAMLHENGVLVDPDPLPADDDRNGGPLLPDHPQWQQHQGKTLAEAIKHFLKVSENAVGEMVLLKLAETFGEDNEVSWPSGAKVISDWLINEAGLEEGSFRLVDGSGLSRYNLISADSSIRLLAYMKTHEHFEPFFDGLPVYKVALPEGGAFNGVPLAEFDAERVFAKPGGMSGVNTISGYVQTLGGRWLAFSLLGNGYIGSSAPVRDLRNRVWSELVRYQPAAVEAVAE